MAKAQNKKLGKRNKGPGDAENPESAGAVQCEGTTEQAISGRANVPTTGNGNAKGGATETVEKAEKDKQGEEKSTTDGKQVEKNKKRKWRRRKGKKLNNTSNAKQGEKAGDDSDEKKKKRFSGLIFMCNKATKEDCFKHRVFGLPEAKKDIVEQVIPGMKLFLFDVDQRLLYGVYEASSKGGMNLQPKAFSSSKKGFPAQVKFRIRRDSLPLSEDVFKPTIQDNYIAKKKFSIELSADQVKKLQQLFNPVSAQEKKNTGVRNGRRPTMDGGRFNRPVATAVRPGYDLNGIQDARGRQEMPLYGDLRYSVRDHVLPPVPAYGVDPVITDADLRRLEYTRGSGIVPADPYHLTKVSLAGISTDTGYGLANPGLEADPLYRQRLSVYSDAPLRQLGKRPLEDPYPSDYHTLPMPKRARLQDDLLYRDLEYQRTAAYPAERVLPRYYTGGLW